MAAKRTERFSVVLGAVDKISAPIRKINRRIESVTAPLKKVRRQMQALAREAGFSKLGNAMRGLGRTLARVGTIGVAAVGGLFLALKRTSESMDTLAKTTRALNFPVEEFQRWKQVAQLAGVDAEKFDKAIQKLSKNVGELRLNTGTMSTILDKADPAFKRQLQNAKTNAEAFDLVIDRMRGLTNAQDRAALANAAFGRSGADLINIANLTSKEVARLREEVQANGGIISGKALANAEAFQDSLLLLKTALANIWAEIAGRLFPIVVDLMDQFREWATTHKEIIKTNAVEFFEKFVETGKAMFAGLKVWIPKVLDMVETLGGLKTVLLGIAAVSLVPLVSALVSLSASLVAIGAVLGLPTVIAILAAAGIGAGLVAAANLPTTQPTSFPRDGITLDDLHGGTLRPEAVQRLRIQVDQTGRVTGAEVESGANIEIESEGLVGEAF